MNKESIPYRTLCTEFYDLDKPVAPEDALQWYLQYAKEANGPILEPMCGTGRFLIPLIEQGYTVTGFDSSNHMLDKCREKGKQCGLIVNLQDATFETFSSKEHYQLIFIPSGSFCHLITSTQVSAALGVIANKLTPGGKFVCEIETLKSVREPQGIWKGKWVDRADGSKIVMSVLTQFCPISRIETGLFRYELWEENAITRSEVESFYIRHYEQKEIESIFDAHGLKVKVKWQAEPHLRITPDKDTPFILYECVR